MKSLLKSKIFCGSQGMVIQRRFLCTVLCMPWSAAVIKTAKKAKYNLWSWTASNLYSTLFPWRDFSLFFYLDYARERSLLCFVNFLCGQYILNSNVSERIALWTCLQCFDAFGRSLVALTGCKWINGSFCQKLWLIWLLLVVFSSL